ncbi:OmpA/MotB domain-containing protein [Candidatus Symbiothrix dinenymphae]|nr:OmpA/MotB domain-containing protein [Candidatus Symbiothrix dinenymphae]
MNSAPVRDGVDHGLGFLGGGVGGDFTYFINQRVGFTTGIGADFFRHEYYLPKFSEDGIPEYDADVPPELFAFGYEAFGYTERQEAILLSIPVRVQYETRKFYAAGGLKVGIPFARYTYSLDNIKTTGYFKGGGKDALLGYPDEEGDLELGFGAYPNKTKYSFPLRGTNGLQFNTAFFVTAEVGVKWTLKLRKFSLYTGAYIEWGPTNIRKDVIQPNIKYDASEYGAYDGAQVRFDVNSALSSGVSSDNMEELIGRPYSRKLADKDAPGAFVDKVQPLYFGLKLAFSIEHYIHDPKIRLRPRYKSVPVTGGTSQPSENAFVKDLVTTNVERLQVINQLQRSMTNSELGFAFGKSDLSENGRKTLDKKIRLLQSWPDIAIRIEGHTDDIGTDEDNMLLGQQRADAVRDYMVKNGVDKRRIRRVDSKGESQPAVPNDSEENRAQNRRVQIIVLESWAEE